MEAAGSAIAEEHLVYDRRAGAGVPAGASGKGALGRRHASHVEQRCGDGVVSFSSSLFPRSARSCSALNQRSRTWGRWFASHFTLTEKRKRVVAFKQRLRASTNWTRSAATTSPIARSTVWNQ